MTSGDPYEPNPEIQRVVRRVWGPGMLFSIAIVGLILIAAIVYGLSQDRSPPTAAAPRLTTPAPSTTGQGGNAPAPSEPQTPAGR